MDRSLPTLVLLTHARAGDASAREELFERIYPKLKKIVALRMGCRAKDLNDRDDIIQMSLQDTLESFEAFEPRGEGALLHWLARIVRNNLTDSERYRRAQRRDVGRLARCGDGDTVLTDSLLAAQGPTPSQVAQGAETEALIEEAMLELSERERRVIELRLLCEMPFEDVARELGLGTESAARSTLTRAMKELRNRLARKLQTE